MEITVKVVLSGDPELLTTLATLVQSIEEVVQISSAQKVEDKPKPRKKKTAEPAPEPVKAEQEVPKTEPEPVKAEQEVPKTEPEPAKEEPVTVSDFQDKVKGIVMSKPAGTSKKVLELLKEYGLSKVREVPAEKQAEFLAKVEAL